jgi:hypothetical protein
MTTGIPGDVNNSVFLQGTYPAGRSFGWVGAAATDFSMRNNYVGEIGGLNQDYARSMAMSRPAGASMAAPAAAPAMRNGNGSGKRPAFAWLVFAIVFIVVAWSARKFAPDGEQFAIIKPNLINWVFVTLTVLLTTVFLKQVALRVEKIPFLEPAAKLVLSA